MPTTYTHWHFGQECIEILPDELKKTVNDHRDLYDIGVHGPDIFFYDLLHKDISSYASAAHEIAAKEFFDNARDAYAQHSEKEEMIAYLLGFLSHFVLDSSTHGYVERKAEVSDISHNAIEAEYDGHMMRLDGRAVHLVDRVESLKPNLHNATIISYFFPFDARTIYRTLKGQKILLGSLNCVSDLKRKILGWLFLKLGQKDYHDLLVPKEETEGCRDSNLRLDKLRKIALKRYPVLLENLLDHLNNEEELDKYFDHGFGPWKSYRRIPVLCYEDELHYKVR
ncbi:MAG: zinc dependent phospholipase C family protein [Erysipelotrichaceae bacterium]|nr:zinc dependent phospholipase C family protein [Erysipelotrichaceae bacterium]